MKSEFKSKVIAYQQTGDRTIINDIISAVENDFMLNGTRERFQNGYSGAIRIHLNDHHEYIAYRIRAMRELIMRHIETDLIGNSDEEFQRLLSIIYVDFGIKFAPYVRADYELREWDLTEEIFEVLAFHMEEIEERFGEMFGDHYNTYFKRLYDEHKASEMKTRTIRANRRKQIGESAVNAIEYALKYVNADRDEMEIVKYINKTFSCKLADDERERNGMRTIQRKGAGTKRTNYVVEPYFPTDVYRVVLGINVPDERIETLSKGQREFITNIAGIVSEDMRKDATDEYTCELDGEARIRKEYIAGLLDMKSATVRQKLKRIKEKLS